MTEANNTEAFLANILEQVISHLDEEHARRAANCARLRTENESLRAASRLNAVGILTSLPQSRDALNLSRQLEVQQASADVVRTCNEQAEQAKLHAEEQYKEYSAAAEMQGQAEQHYDQFTMMPYHEVAAEIERLKTARLEMQAKTAALVEARQARQAQMEARVKEMEAEIKLYDRLIVEINDGEVEELTLAVQQAKQQNKQSVKRAQELETEIAALQHQLTELKP